MTNPALNYKELSMFLLGESIRLTEHFLEDLHEEDSPNSPFNMCGPRKIIENHKLIGLYLKYANIAYQCWIDEPPKDGES